MARNVFKFWTKDYKHIECDLVQIEGDMIEKIWCKNGVAIPYHAFNKLYLTHEGAYMYCFTRETEYFMITLYKYLLKEMGYYKYRAAEFEKNVVNVKSKMLDMGMTLNEENNNGN